MSGKVSRFLRKWATHSKVGNNQVKRAWHNTPRNKRDTIKGQLLNKMYPEPGVILDIPA